MTVMGSVRDVHRREQEDAERARAEAQAKLDEKRARMLRYGADEADSDEN